MGTVMERIKAVGFGVTGKEAIDWEKLAANERSLLEIIERLDDRVTELEKERDRRP